MAPATVTLAPWVATSSHWKRAATRAAIETTEAASVPEPTPSTRRNIDDAPMRATAPPIMMSSGRMLR